MKQRILRDYQEAGIIQIAQLLKEGKKRICRQLMTGGGKTVEFATICDRFTRKSNKRVLILVHRVELLNQAIKTLYDWYGIIAQRIDADTKGVHDRMVYVAMVETAFRRLSRNENYLPPIGMIIIDEAHRGEFKKIGPLFPDAYLLGYTATPISSSKKDPLKNYFDEIVVGPTASHLIEIGSLVQNHTYSINEVNRKKLKMKAGEFDSAFMGMEYSKAKHVHNTLHWYKKVGKGKAIIYNCSISHSKLVLDCFTEAGYNCRHVDGGTPDNERAAIFKWFSETQGAILCNVDIATTGTDIPSVETIIMNRATTSIVVWLQCTGRGARPYPDKEQFIILDMGGNARADAHGDWSDDRDWHDIFQNPAKPREKTGAAPVKECPNCQSIIPVQSMTCKFCQYIFPKKNEYDKDEVELILITKKIDLQGLIKRTEQLGYKEYTSLYQIGTNIFTQAKHKVHNLTDSHIEKVIEIYQEKAAEWCKLKNKRFNDFHKTITRNHIIKQYEQSRNSAVRQDN